MLDFIKRWYDGETEIVEFNQSENGSGNVFPMLYIRYHWTARIARILIGFYLNNWQWFWTILVAMLAAYFGFAALKK